MRRREDAKSRALTICEDDHFEAIVWDTFRLGISNNHPISVAIEYGEEGGIDNTFAQIKHRRHTLLIADMDGLVTTSKGFRSWQKSKHHDSMMKRITEGIIDYYESSKPSAIARVVTRPRVQAEVHIGRSVAKVKSLDGDFEYSDKMADEIAFRWNSWEKK